MKALIRGAGIAGLTLAWHLERSGWEVELVEHAPAFRDGDLERAYRPYKEEV